MLTKYIFLLDIIIWLTGLHLLNYQGWLNIWKARILNITCAFFFVIGIILLMILLSAVWILFEFKRLEVFNFRNWLRIIFIYIFLFDPVQLWNWSNIRLIFTYICMILGPNMTLFLILLDFIYILEFILIVYLLLAIGFE
jgi:hypothetical protein